VGLCERTRVPAILTEGLTKFYGRHRGIEELTMTVEQGEVFGFLGPNGAGKTTTIRTLLDLLHPSGGSARILGLDSRADSVAIRARLGNLPGDFGFGERTSGHEALSLLARLRHVDSLERAEDLAGRFRADLARPLGQLSRGNRQKIGLLLALFHRPELLILDEPTSGLDPLMQEEFLALIGEERERGCTVFLSSHELDEVERVCDRVGIIRDGRLIAVERVAELVGKTQRRVSVEFAEPIDPGELRGCAGVCALEADGAHVTFGIAGDIDPVIKAIARHTIVDIDFARPTLEEIFLSYYQDEAKDGTA
jgi:ABC-2 type transport system ATP-binding protein